MQTSQGNMMGHKTTKKFVIVLKGGGKVGYHIPEIYELLIQIKLKFGVRSLFDIFFCQIISLP
jgi:hypothetical protein